MAKVRENPISVRSKNAISAITLKLLMYKPLSAISISEIAGRAGLSRQTFYANFCRKEDVVAYLIDGLFEKYLSRIEGVNVSPESFLIHYFIFLEDSGDFLRLLFRRNLGYIFLDRNRAFFGSAACIDTMFSGEPWQLPYIKAGLAGITCQLIETWVLSDEGIPADAIANMAENLMSGDIFAQKTG